MRLGLVAAILMIAGTAGLKAQEPVQPVPQPVPYDGECKIRSDPSWSPQEQFVWSRVCVGKMADFNEGLAYGGDLDPSDFDPKKHPLARQRILRPKFLETILLDAKYRLALTRKGVRIIGAWFTQPLDLENAVLGHELWLRRSLFEHGIDFLRVTSSQAISLNGSKVDGDLDMIGLQDGQSLFIKGARLSRVDLVDANIREQLDLSGTKVNGMLEMGQLQVGDAIFLKNAILEEVDLSGARVGGTLALLDATISKTLSMDGLHVGGDLNISDDDPKDSKEPRQRAHLRDVSLVGAQVAGYLRLWHATVTGPLTMDGLRVGQTLQMAYTDLEDVSLLRARVGGQLSLKDAQVFGTLTMERLQVGDLMFLDNSWIEGEVDLSGAQLGASFELLGATIRKKLSMDGAHVGGDLNISDEDPPKDSKEPRKSAHLAIVSMIGAQVAGYLRLGYATATGPFTMDGLRVDQSVRMDYAVLKDVSLPRARVKGRFFLTGAPVSGNLMMSELRVGEQMYIDGDNSRVRDLDLSGGELGGGLDLSGLTVTGKLLMNELKVGRDFDVRRATFWGPVAFRSGRVGANALFSGTTLHNNVDLTGTVIAGRLSLADCDPGTASERRSIALARWPDATSSLTLESAKAEEVQDLHRSDVWPEHIELTGFRYREFAVYGEGQCGVGAGSTTDRGANWYVRWLQKQKPYSPLPYRQLAKVLEDEGRSDLADTVLYKSRERERAQASRWHWAGLTILSWAIGYGYGYRTIWAILWLSAVVFVGILVQLDRRSVKKSQADNANSSRAGWREIWGSRHEWWQAFVYSFEMLLPLVRLRGQSREFHTSFHDVYFHLQNVAGLVLFAILAAGLSGLTR